jgi:hypothetical protein
MGMIDDATNLVLARFYDHEGTVPALDSFRSWVQRYGIPASVYLDKHTTYRSPQLPSPEEQLRGLERSQSQFERAMSELGVEVIHAHSPAAKGRIERLFGTFQDRLIKEMRLERVASLSEANRFLEHYLPSYNQRFRVEPAQAADLHRRRPRQLDLDSVLCLKTLRRLNPDSTVIHQGKVYLVEQQDKPRPSPSSSGWTDRYMFVIKDAGFAIGRLPIERGKPRFQCLRANHNGNLSPSLHIP